jgi:predicted nuclease of predicted toxin-antitoxin system
MGTLASELGGHIERLSGQPRVYVDANIPATLVSFMRHALRWDVLFVLEHDDLRRAHDGRHFELARQLRRTLVTQDRDYLDDRRFPPGESAGVLVLTAPSENGLMALLKRLDRGVLRPVDSRPGLLRSAELPLEGRKILVHVDWGQSPAP